LPLDPRLAQTLDFEGNKNLEHNSLLKRSKAGNPMSYIYRMRKKLSFMKRDVVAGSLVGSSTTKSRKLAMYAG
jgi:isochorismate synthase EntC